MVQSSNFVRALPYPALEEGNASYPQGQYSVSMVPGKDGHSVDLGHTITEANFITRALEAGRARYGCLIVVPLTGYRKLHLFEEPNHSIDWNLDVVGEPPMLRPLVVAVTEISSNFTSDDGVASLWQDISVKIPKGARLAISDYFRPTASLYQMLEIEHVPDMPSGTFEVQACTEEGFYFKAQVASDLYGFLQNPGEYTHHQGSLYTHMVSRCFEILVSDYRDTENDDSGSSEFSNLRALQDELIKNNLPTWHDEHFLPDKVATQLYPHEPTSGEPDEDDDS